MEPSKESKKPEVKKVADKAEVKHSKKPDSAKVLEIKSSKKTETPMVV